MGGAERPLTDSRSQVLQLREGGAANHLRPPPAHQNQLANRGDPGRAVGTAVVDPTWDCGAITQREKKKRKSNLRKEKTHGGGGVRSDRAGGRPVFLTN